jgi:hypothetical protein
MLLLVATALLLLKQEYSLCIVKFNLVFDLAGKVLLLPHFFLPFGGYLFDLVFDLLGLDIFGFESKSFIFRFRLPLILRHSLKQIHIRIINLHGSRSKIHRRFRNFFKPCLIIMP